MTDRASDIDASLGFDGLVWRPNLWTHAGRGTVQVIESDACGVVEFLYHRRGDAPPAWLSLHQAQDDLLTFLGAPAQTVRAVFVDCRHGSRTLHQRIDHAFRPDPTRHLNIPRGIGHAVYAKSGITVRVETRLYVSPTMSVAALQNDSANFRPDDPPHSWPVVTPADLPLPREASALILSQQQAALAAGTLPRLAAPMRVAGEERLVSAGEQSGAARQEAPVSEDRGG